jgi:nitrate/nitrite transporter NarK
MLKKAGIACAIGAGIGLVGTVVALWVVVEKMPTLWYWTGGLLLASFVLPSLIMTVHVPDNKNLSADEREKWEALDEWNGLNLFAAWLYLFREGRNPPVYRTFGFFEKK